jgi:polar amino acid transport system substrate-binding protein
MSKVERKWFYFVFAVLVVAIVAYLGYNIYQQQVYPTVTSIKNKGVLIVGTSADFPPFEYVNQSGAIVGLDIDIANAIAKELGVKLVVKDLSFDALISALQGKQVDLVIAGMTITPERSKVVDFSVPYYNASQAVISLTTQKFSGVNDLKNKKIGVQTGTTGESWAEDNLVNTSVIPESNLFHYDKLSDALLALKRGDIDAIIIDEPVARMFVRTVSGVQYDFGIYTGEQYGIAINKDSKDLLNLVNTVINNMKSSGQLDSLVQKWFGSG